MSTNEEIAELFDRHVMATYSPKIALVKGSGTKVWDADGKVYLDFLAGIAVLNVGYSHPKVVAAIQAQVDVLTHVSNLYYTENQARLAERLTALALGGKCFFANSGAEANECMIKLARLWGHEQGRYEIICMKNSFHGRTLATAAATGQEKVQKGFEPMPEGFCHAEYNDIESVASMVSEKTVAIMLEPVQGEGGVVPATDGFMRGIRELCDEKDLLMLCDEVQCGMGRTGHWFAFQGYGVEPDAFSLAKALGSGYPIGAVVSGPKLADLFQPGRRASTFGGTPLACAAALATMDVIEEEGLVTRAARVGGEFLQALRAMADKFEHVKEVRGRGLMIGIVLDQSAVAVVDMLADIGLLSLATAENVVRFLPPLNVKDNEIAEALDIIEDCLAEWHGISLEDEEEAVEDAEEPVAAADDAAAEEVAEVVASAEEPAEEATDAGAVAAEEAETEETVEDAAQPVDAGQEQQEEAAEEAPAAATEPEAAPEAPQEPATEEEPTPDSESEPEREEPVSESETATEPVPEQPGDEPRTEPETTPAETEESQTGEPDAEEKA